MRRQKADGGFPKRHARRRGKAFNKTTASIIELVVPKDKTVADLGAGPYGMYVKWMLANGWESVIGIDGSEGVEEFSEGLIAFGDLSIPWPLLRWPGDVPDWIISFEVGEHIPADKGGVFLDNLAVAKEGILMSWGLPGQKGFQHINCRMSEWVACEMGKRGFSVDHDKTIEARSIAKRGFRNRILVLKRETFQ